MKLNAISIISLILASLSLILTASASDHCDSRNANPSVYHFTIGRTQAAVISDGTLTLSPAGLWSQPQLATEAYRNNFRLGPGQDPPLLLSLNTLYLKRPDGTQILIDTGVGTTNAFGTNPPDGNFQNANLKAIGISPEEIDVVLLTHSHFDHTGNILTPNGSLIFPNALHYISRREFEFFTTDPVDLSTIPIPDNLKQILIQTSQRPLKGIPKTQLRLFDFNTQLLPGIRALKSNHHTPGHVSYNITDISTPHEQLIFTGDLLYDRFVSVQRPWQIPVIDIDREGGIRNRTNWMDVFARDRVKVLMYHYEFPGLGYIVETRGGWDFLPVSYEGDKGVRTVCLKNRYK